MLVFLIVMGMQSLADEEYVDAEMLFFCCLKYDVASICRADSDPPRLFCKPSQNLDLADVYIGSIAVNAEYQNFQGHIVCIFYTF